MRHREERSDAAIQRVLLDCFAALAMTVLLLFALPAAAQTFPEHKGSPLVDQAGLLRPEQAIDLKSKLDAAYARTGHPFVVVTVNSLEGLEIEDYGTRLGRHWQLGEKDKDDGIILLVAPNERKVRIETGYGAEGFLPDIMAGRIIRNTILPKFKDKDLAGGIMAGADAIITQMELPPEEAAKRAEAAAAAERKRAEVDINPLPIIFMVIIFFVIVGSIARRAGGRRYRRRGAGGIDPWVIVWGLNELSKASRGRSGGWGGGSGWSGGGGGGFGGFGGGGSFGGGGASGSW